MGDLRAWLLQPGLTFWSGTCPILFERVDGATRTLSVAALEDRLNRDLRRFDT
jgi:hypothetical protein